MTSALHGVSKPGSEVHGRVFGASLLRNRKFVQGEGEYLVRDGVCMLLGKVFGGVAGPEAALPIICPLDTVLVELLSRKWLAPFVVCMRELMCVDEVRVFVENV